MMERLISNITRWYDIQTACYRAERRFEKTQEDLKQRTWELRTKNKAEKEYAGSLRSMLDKLAGKRDKLEILRRETQEAKERFEQTVAQWQMLSSSSVELQKQYDKLPPLEELKAAAADFPEAARYLAQREILLCAEMLQPLLEETQKALEEYHQQLRGDRMGEIVTAQRLHEIETAHIAWGNQCAELLHRMEPSMKCLGKSFEIPGYFLSTDAYVASMVAKHNRLDRINLAREQAESTQRQIHKLLETE